MENTILKYQNAYNSLVEKLRGNKSVIAAMVFGSVITGDLWDESDIDLFVIIDEDIEDIKNVYMEEKGIQVHIKLLSKNKFIQFYDEDLKGGFIYRVFASSKLVFSKDLEITSRYDSCRYYPDLDRERWTMVYLGNVMKNLGVCKKYLYNDGIYTAFSSAIKCTEEFAKLYVNSYGYMVSKDAMTIAMNLNDEFKQYVDKLVFDKEDIKGSIENFINFIEEDIDKNIKQNASILLDYMREKDSFLSVEDIKEDALFCNFNIDIKEILDKLLEKNIIKRETKDYKLPNGKVLFNENVYFI